MGAVDARVEHRHDRRTGGINHLVGQVPADPGQRPLIGVLGVVGGACDGTG